MAQKVEYRTSVLQQVQSSKFEPNKGSSGNKPVGFRPNHPKVTNIVETRDSITRSAGRNTNSPVHTATKSTTLVEKSEEQFRRLSDSEFTRKRQKGLYFRCDEEFVLNHRHKNRQLNLLIISGTQYK